MSCDEDETKGLTAATGHAAAKRPRFVRRAALFAGTAIAAGLLATAAHAQLGPARDPGPAAGVDTPYTPIAKEPPDGLFTQVAGARFNPGRDVPQESDLVRGSATAVDADLHAVSFKNPGRGFAGGTIDKDGLRTPVLYEYTEAGGWQAVTGLATEGQGFVGEIAWIDDQRALAVGGDGIYPDRERDDGSSHCAPGGGRPDNDQAGAARAWLYETGKGWRELRNLPDGRDGDELPDEMGGLTALDFFLPDPANPIEFGVAGGLCQIWHWSDGGFLRHEDGEFADPYSNTSPPEKLASQETLQFRVRSVSFAKPVPELPDSQRKIEVFATTAGCCAIAAARPATLVYDSQHQRGQWRALPADLSRVPSLAWSPPPDSNVSVTATQVWVRRSGAGTQPQQRELRGPGLVSSPAGPRADTEPPSHVGGDSVGHSSARLLAGEGDVGGGTRRIYREGPSNTSTEVPFPVEPGVPVADVTVEYLEGHNGFSTNRIFVQAGEEHSTGPDGVPDWSVGELTGSGQAVAYATDPSQLPGPKTPLESPPPLRTCDRTVLALVLEGGNAEPLACTLADTTDYPGQLAGQHEQPTDDPKRVVPATVSHKLLKLPAYSLRAIEVLDGHDQGWAVGDHGAILKLNVDRSSSRRSAGEPDPPRLGAAEEGALPDHSPWEKSGSSGTDDVGTVPPLAKRKRGASREPRFALEGVLPASGIVHQILASRTGDEAWALLRDPSSTGTSTTKDKPMDLAHFDGERWTYCDPDAPDRESGPDPACHGLEDLRKQGVRLLAAARVPYERDENPANDDEFELVALGGPTGIVRYRRGRWASEGSDAVAGLRLRRLEGAKSIAFVAPDEGWVSGERVSGGSLGVVRPHRFYRFNGQRWSECLDRDHAPADDLCDPHTRLPQRAQDEDAGEITSLHAAGNRLYAIGRRSVETWSGGDAHVQRVPLILYRRPGESGWSEMPRDGEYDPGHSGVADPWEAGRVASLGVFQRPDGAYEGWATGAFGLDEDPMLRMPPGGAWRIYPDSGAASDYDGGSAVVMHGDGGGSAPEAFLAGSGSANGQILRFNDRRRRWELTRSDRRPGAVSVESAAVAGSVTAVTPDGKGGLWSSVLEGSRFAGTRRTFLYRRTARARKPVFSEVAQPSYRSAQRTITALAGSLGGSLWAATNSEILYRYDRRLGWDSVRVPGWDPGRVVTAPSPVHAIALDAKGEGLAVGRGGRIASIDSERVVLDAAAGSACRGVAAPPCGTPHDLRAVDLAPDGAALAAGENRSILWRPASGEFRAIDPPQIAPNVTITAVAMSSENRGWIATDTGRLYRGSANTAGGWSWDLEHIGAPLRAMELDHRGHGYAVGDGGLIVERGESGRWQRLPAPTDHDLFSLALPPDGGDGALIGGVGGLILTRTKAGFEVVSYPEIGEGLQRVVSLALLPGSTSGQVQAWAAVRLGGDEPRMQSGRLLHYDSERDETGGRSAQDVSPLPDSPPERPGEVSFAAFGKSDCWMQPITDERCAEVSGSTEYADLMSSRIIDDTLGRAGGGSGPDFSIFTGDAADVAGYSGGQAAASLAGHRGAGRIVDTYGAFAVHKSNRGREKMRRWGELVSDRMTDGGVPLFGAVGAQDLTENRGCDPVRGSCVSSRDQVKAGENLAWRQAMANRSQPWGSGTRVEHRSLRFRAVGDTLAAQRGKNHGVEGGTAGLPERKAPTGGAPTHYAIDVLDDARNPRQVARIVVLDSSFGSLAAGEAVQQPLEPDGGQAAWLQKMLCVKGQRTGLDTCTRRDGQQAIVVTNAPTYSYGPGVGTDTAPDGAALEAILMAHQANVVVSGRIGWNGLYWATAPGIHEPCPGQGYSPEPPRGGVSACGNEAGSGLPQASPAGAQEALASVLATTTLPSTAVLDSATAPAESLTRALPFVVASGAGGSLADPQGEARDGFWHGYTTVRLDPSGDPQKTIVEQRPIYDFIGIEAAERTLRPGQRMRLRGFGRGPIGVRLYDVKPVVRYDRIDGPAVTHRYDLLAADEESPWLPAKDDAGEYVALDPTVAAVDRHSGQIRAGRGNHPRAYAVAMLSVGDHVATYPLVFEPRRTFVPAAQQSPPRTPSVIVQSAAAGIAPPASPGTPPQVGALSPPALPSFPTVQPPPAVPPVGQPQPAPPPPPPPAPPPPASVALAAAPPGLTVAPPAAVVPPPAPPINPAPPGGARKEARQRQAATEKSGSGSGSEASDTQHLGGDQAREPMAPPGAEMTRLDRTKASPSFTAVGRPDQPSAWARGAVYGGGLTLASLALAGLWTARPRPRPRPPAVPAPARAWARRR